MKSHGLFIVLALSSVALAAVPIYGQCGGVGYTGETTCESGSCCTYANEWYSQCIACDSNDSSSGSDNSSSGGTATTVDTPTRVTTTIPASQGAVYTNRAISVSGTFDGGMKLYDRSPAVCQEQVETGEADAMFILADGATLQNVIIGPSQAEGVHCRGTCTLINVYWQDVCEDALTLKQSSGTSYVIGGGAWHAEDKIIQFNGFGTVSVQYFYANDYGKVVRSCGNCSGNGAARHIIMDGVVAVNGGPLCGINTNYQDTCTITDSCQNAGKSCESYTGNSWGGEPTKIGSGPDGTYCMVSGLTSNC